VVGGVHILFGLRTQESLAGLMSKTAAICLLVNPLVMGIAVLRRPLFGY
jgi:hypothetical protein